ncbi:MAG TPA: ribosome-binding factor A [Acidimicrobiales bacterium]
MPREARLGELLREVLADELQAIDDERLEHVAITAVDVDREMNRGIVYFDSYRGEDADPEILAAFAERRVRLQAAIGRQVRARKTPILEFRPDDVIRSAERIDALLRDLPVVSRPDGTDANDVTATEDADLSSGTEPGDRPA